MRIFVSGPQKMGGVEKNVSDEEKAGRHIMKLPNNAAIY